MSSLKMLKKNIEELYEKQEAENQWNNSEFEKVNSLKIDYSGKVGELFLVSLCKEIIESHKEEFQIKYEYFGDSTADDGSFDIIINNVKIEVKTARLGKDGKSFQHENLKKHEILNGVEVGADVFIFIDITPNCFYISFLKYKEFIFEKKNKIFNRTPHLRKGTNNIYKFDISQKQILSVIEDNEGHSLKVSKETSTKDIIPFLREAINI